MGAVKYLLLIPCLVPTLFQDSIFPPLNPSINLALVVLKSILYTAGFSLFVSDQ